MTFWKVKECLSPKAKAGRKEGPRIKGGKYCWHLVKVKSSEVGASTPLLWMKKERSRAILALLKFSWWD